MLSGCGGGGGGASSSGGVPSGPTPTPDSVTTSQTVSSSGGTTSVTLNGQTATVTIPSGALGSAATIKLTLYAAANLPVTFSKARRAQSVPTGATALAGLVVDDGGVVLNAPLQVAFSGLAAPAGGTSVLLSGYAGSTWDDVAAMTYAGSAYSENTDPHYPGISLAAQTPYVLYSVPTASVAAPAATVNITGPASVGAASQATYVAAEATANGFPFLSHTFTYGLTSVSLGTIGASTGAFTAGGAGGIGNVTATDSAVGAFSGRLAVAVTTARPGASGLSEEYTGTLRETDANYVIAAFPVSTTSSANATVNVTAAAANGGSGDVVFTAEESDVAPLTTLTAATTSTVAYQTQGGGTLGVRAMKTVAVESTGVTYEHDYGANDGLLTVLPEATGTFANDAGEEYKETDPGIGVGAGGAQGVTTDRVVAANGTYTASIQEPSYTTGAATTDTATENADFSGVLALNSYDPNAFVVDYSAPLNRQITVTLVDPNLSLYSPYATPSWIPSSLVQPSVETDTITAGATIDGSCSPAAGFSGSANLIQQQLTIADVVDGTLETRTTKSYDVNGIGTVCTIVTDTIETFYDFTGQEGPYLIYFAGSATNPVLETTVTETLSLQTSNVAQVASAGRRTQSFAPQATLSTPAFATRVAHLARARIDAQIQAFRRRAVRSLLRGGPVK